MLFNKEYVIYTSTLKRTIQTAEALLPNHLIKDNLQIFNELDCHELDNTLKNNYTREELNSKLSISKEIICKQIRQILLFLYKEQTNNKNILVFSHGMLIRAILLYLNEIYDFDIYDLVNSIKNNFYNLSIAEIDIFELQVNNIIL